MIEYEISEILFFYEEPQNLVLTQSAFTFSKLTIETLEQGVKYVQNKQ